MGERGGGGWGKKCVIFERTSNSLCLSLVLLCITILFNYVRFQGRELILDISMLEISDYLPIALNYFLIFVKFWFSLWEEY